MTEALQQLIDAVKTLAPQVWEIYMRQAIVNGWLNLIGGLLISIISLIGIVAGMREHLKAEDENEIIVTVGIMGGGVLLILGIGVLVTGVQYMLNPSYYAIQMLVHP